MLGLVPDPPKGSNRRTGLLVAEESSPELDSPARTKSYSKSRVKQTKKVIIFIFMLKFIEYSFQDSFVELRSIFICH